MQIRWLPKSLLAGVFALCFFANALNAFAQTHVSNPFVGAKQYTNPDYTKELQALAATTTDPVLKAQLNTITTYSTGIWMDRISAIAGSSATGGRLGLQEQLDNAVLVQQAAGQPVVIPLVIYDLPDRDCAARASNGELTIAANPPAQPLDGLTTYNTQYIDVIANILKNPKYVNLRFALIIEPDSLPNLVTNTGKSFTIANCQLAQSSGVYVNGIRHALDAFHPIPNAYLYLDIGHSGWLGWSDNAQAAVNFFTPAIQGAAAGLNSIDGFIDNTANYTPLKEPFFDANQMFNGNRLVSASFYEFNATVDEAGYAVELQTLFRAAGWPVSSTNFITDTSRNGWGGPNRPAAASTSTDLNTFVNQSKIDRRNHRGQWCNQSGAGLGIPPLAAPPDFPQFQAYVWIKPPGESDGTYPGSANQGDALHADPNCDPAQTNPLAGNTATGSIANSPPAGNFFVAELIQNIQNSFPVVPSDSNPTFTMFGNGLSVMQGASGTTSITVLPVNNFAGNVTLSISGLPAGVTTSLNPTTIPGGSGISILTVNVAANAPVPNGPVPLTVTGTSGSITKTAVINLTIVGRPDFSVTAVTPSVTLTPNSNPTATVSVASLFGFTGSVSMTASNLPQGVSANFSPSSVNGSGTIVVNFNGQTSTPVGTTTILITGTSGTLVHSAPITFIVTGPNDFSLTATNASVAQGGTGTSTVTVHPSGSFAGSVNLSASGVPSGVTATFNPQSTTGTSTLTFAASATAPSGAFTVTITGVSGNLTHSTTITLAITNQDFSLSASPANVSITAGGPSASSTITVTPLGGFAGTVTLSVGATPAGVSATLSGNTVTFTASSTAAAGTATVVVTGTSGMLIHTTPISVTVIAPDFSLSANPVNISITQGGPAASSTITVTPLGGFTGSVTLSASGVPTGVTTAFSTNPTTGTSVLSFTASATATAGPPATVTVTGTSGAHVHTTTINLTVNTNTPGFTLSPSPASVTVVQGGAAASSTITVVPTNGFTGSVTLSASGVPTGVSTAFSTNPTTGTSVLSFTASGTATTGNATVTVTGTSGTLTRTTAIALTVNPAVTGTGGVTVSTVINQNSAFFNDQGVKITNTSAITSMSLTISVQATPGVSFSGQFNTVGGQITQSHSSTASVITYQFNLAPGGTLSPGSGYLFDAQMGGNGTLHPTTGDTFTVTYTTAAGGATPFIQSGRF